MSEKFEDIIGKDIRKGNPFRGIYVPESSKILLDIAFKRALRTSPPGGVRLNIIKKKKSVTITRIKVLSEELSNALTNLVKKFPSTDTMHPFYLSTMEIWLSKDDYKKTLAKIHGAAQLIRRIARDYIIQIRSTRKTEVMAVRDVLNKIDRLRQEAYGRISSVVNSLDKDLRTLANLVKKMKRLPDYDPELPTIVVAGPPNSGKSSFVKTVSNARVEIASYPFTTKEVTFGHIELRVNHLLTKKVQIADTPGLFDRPLNERKEPELLALKAIQHIADIVLFLFDGSTEAVMNMEEQLGVYKTVKTFFGSGKPFIIAVNKMDIADKDLVNKISERVKKDNAEVFYISIKTGQNIDTVLNKIKELLEQH